MNTSNDEALALLLKADAARCSAMLAHDINALEPLLADDIVYTHSSAVVDTKQQYLSAMREGRLRYLGIHPQDVNVRLYGTVAVMNGRAAMHVKVEGNEKHLDNLFQSVWVEREGRWQMASWASTLVPASAKPM